MTRSHTNRTLIDSAVVLACSMSLCAFAGPEPGGANRAIKPIALHNEQGDVSTMVDPRNPCRNGTPWFDGIGHLPYGYESDALGISPDGQFVVGFSTGYDELNDSWAFTHAIGWNACTGLHGLAGTPSDSVYSSAYSISNTGRHVAGVVGLSYDYAGLWTTASSDVIGLANPNERGYQRNSVVGVSADGQVFAGTTEDNHGNEAFIYTLGQPQGIMLGYLPGGFPSSETTALSHYGNAVVGRSYSPNGSEAFRWTQAQGMVGLGDLPGGSFDSRAMAVSSDGEVVVGYGSVDTGYMAFRWTEATGMVPLGDLPGGDIFSEALAVSADGSVIVGRSSTDMGYEAFIWTATGGMRSLRQMLLHQLPQEFAFWQLTAARAISSDGYVVVGSGINPKGLSEGWVLELPHGCRADWNGDNVLNSSDFFTFLNAFFAGDADFTGDNVTNTQDFFDYLNAYFQGC